MAAIAELTSGVSKAVTNFIQNVNDIESFGNYLATIRIFPELIIIHFLLVTMGYRTRPGTLEFSQNHPLASLFVVIVSGYGGKFIANFLLGMSIIEVIQYEALVLIASIVWYLMFFSPLDLVWNVCRTKFMRTIPIVLEEITRLRLIQEGVKVTLNLHPKSWLMIIVIGAVRGSGGKFLMKPLDHFVRGELMSSSELLAPHFGTKSAVIISSLFWLKYTNQIDVPETTLIVSIFTVMSAFQLGFLFTDLSDPYIQVEKVLTYLLIKLPKELFSKDSKAKAD